MAADETTMAPRALLAVVVVVLVGCRLQVGQDNAANPDLGATTTVLDDVPTTTESRATTTTVAEADRGEPIRLEPGPDRDCDHVPDAADAYPDSPNDLGRFMWEDGPRPNRCDLNNNGIRDAFEPDPDAIETEALFIAAEQRQFIADYEAEEAAREAEQAAEDEAERHARAEARTACEARNRDTSAANDAIQAEIDAAWERWSAAIEAAGDSADAAGWTDPASAAYDAALDQADVDLDAALEQHQLLDLEFC